MPGILDMMNEIEEEVEKSRDEERMVSSQSQDSDATGVDNSKAPSNFEKEEACDDGDCSDGGWLVSSRKDSSAVDRGPLRVTNAKNIPLDKLVWAKCRWIKTTHPNHKFRGTHYFPARIADTNEGAIETQIEKWPISGDDVLTEFLAVPPLNKFKFRLEIQNKNELIPYYDHRSSRSNPSSPAKSRQMSMSKFVKTKEPSRNVWNPDMINEMKTKFGIFQDEYSTGKREAYLMEMIEKYNEILKESLEYEEVKEREIAEFYNQEKTVNEEEEEKLRQYKKLNERNLFDFQAKKRKVCPLEAGDWISYDHQIYSKRKIVTRVKEIVSTDEDCEYPLRLLNADNLDRDYEIRRFSPTLVPDSTDETFMMNLYSLGKERSEVEQFDVEKIKNSGELRRICEFDLKMGAIKADSIEVSMRKDVEADEDFDENGHAGDIQVVKRKKFLHAS